jgi:hypothetical protein
MENEIRKISNLDAEIFLNSLSSLPSVITSLPDIEETNLDIEEWKSWFIKIATLIFGRLDKNGFVIFYQTDRKFKGEIINKDYLILNSALRNKKIKPIFHKIVLRQKINSIGLYRPGFTHLLGFSKGKKNNFNFPDVFPAGKMIYKNAMGLNACEYACRFIKNSGVNTIIDPFCGQGSVLAIANKLGLNAIGNDIDVKQCELAKNLNI